MVVPLIHLKKVSNKFGKHIVLKEIDLKINQGDIFGVIGVSGGGKTTLLNIMVGYYRNSSGDVIFNKRKLWRNLSLVHRIFGFARQEGSFYPTLTVKENLYFFGRMYNMPKAKIKSRMKELLRLMGLTEAMNKLAGSLSTGMQRRLDITCALIHQPAVLILDEPTEDLDPVLRKEMLSLIKRVNKEEGTTIIITSHLLGEIETICNQIAILHEGHIIDINSPLGLKDTYSHNKELILQTKSDGYSKILREIDKSDISSFSTKQGKLVIYTPNGEKLLKRILNSVEKDDIVELSLAKPSLEEVFEAVTQRRRSMK